MVIFCSLIIRKKTSPNRAYLAMCFRHFAQILLRRTSDTLETLYDIILELLGMRHVLWRIWSIFLYLCCCSIIYMLGGYFMSNYAYGGITMMIKFIVQTLSTFLIGIFLLGLLLFLPAWSFNYWQAWVFIIVFMFCVSTIGLYLAFKDSALLERRKKVGPINEQSLGQKIAISIGFLALISVFIFSAISHRFSWSRVPIVVSLAGDILVAIGLLINLIVFKENTYGSATVETTADQKVISTGPYALIRHPMYTGVLVMLIGIPLALDAWWSFAIIAIALPGLIWRSFDEEKLLKQDLPGYLNYTKKVKYRLIPYIW